MHQDPPTGHFKGLLPWVDALRGLAILMVLANHVALVVPGLSAPVQTLARFGQMGVQLFFLASAYTLCLSWQQRRADEPQPVLRFLLRRLFRIAPLYWFGIVLFTGLHQLLPADAAADPYTVGNLLANALLVHGVVPAAQNSIVPGGWSIGTEMAFYAAFPLLMAVFARRPGVAAPLAAAAVALVLNLGFQAAQSAPLANNSYAYFHPINQLPVFLIGIALFQWQRRPRSAERWPGRAAGLLGGAALLATAWLWRSGLPLAFALVPTTAGLAFAALAQGASRLRWLPAPLCAIGRRSFAIYLVHSLFAWHGLRLMGAGGAWRGDAAYALALAAVVGLSCIAADLLMRWIERPAIALGRRCIAALPQHGPGLIRRAGSTALALLLAALPGSGRADPPARPSAAPAEARLSLGTALGELPRFGVNLGGRNVWGAEQLMANVLRNPGLEAAFDGALIVVARVDGAQVEDDTRWTARPEGFWAGATFEVLSGPAAGQRGQVLGNRRADAQSPDRLTLAPMPAGLRPGDTLAVRGVQDPTPAPLWWTQGWVQAVAEPRPGSPGQRAIRLRATPGQPASLFHHLDSIGARAGKLLPVQGRWRLVLWARAGSADARLSLSFGRHGRPAWLNQTLSPGRDWQRIDLVVETRDDGPPGPLQLSINVTQGEVLVDDVELGAFTAQPPAGGFRPEVVATLRALRPGYLRDWQGQLADSPANRSAEALARRPIRYRPGANELQFAYSLPEFLALAAAVGARPWVILPATATPDEARAFGLALAQGWQRHHFDEIVVEHGNEHWNAVFRPAGLAQATTLAEVADRAFAALREGAGADLPLHRVIGTQYVNGAAAGRLARLSRHSDGLAVAPYFHYRQDTGETAEHALDRALHEDLKPLQQALADAAALGRSVDVYEVNLHTTLGNATPAERDAVLTAPAAGTALARRLLQAAALGVRRQAVYTLAGYDSFVGGDRRELAQLFGITRDLAGAGHWRSTGQALAALNAVIGGTAHAAACDGPGCAELTAMAFDGGARWALVSSASQAIGVSWPCDRALQLRIDAGPAVVQPCVAGRSRVELPPRSWATALR